jgi:hypothetical protein
MDFAVGPKIQKTLNDMQQLVEREIIPLEPEVAERGFKSVLPRLRAARQKVKDLAFS